MRLLSKVLWVVWYRGLRYLLMVLLSPLLLLIFLSHYLGEGPAINLIYYTGRACEVVVNIGRIVAGVTYLLGVMATVGLLGASLLLMGYTVSQEIGRPIPQLQAYYEIATRIFNQQYTLAAVTTIVGTTVALCHLRNLEVNRARHHAEMRDRRKAEKEERRKKENVRRGPTDFSPVG